MRILGKIIDLFFKIETWCLICYIYLIFFTNEITLKDLVVFYSLMSCFVIKVISKNIQEFIDILKNERN